MPLALPLFVNGTVISATDIDARVVTIEDFLNEGIAQADLEATPWVTTRHLYKPEFYGAPAPRCHALTGDVHWRRAGSDRPERMVYHPEVFNDAWTPVPYLAAPLHVDSVASVTGSVVATFHAYETGGAGGVLETSVAANFRLFLDGASVDVATERSVYVSTGRDSPGIMRKHHTILWDFATGALSVGVHNLSVRIRPSNANQANIRHLYVRGRSLVVDLNYK